MAASGGTASWGIASVVFDDSRTETKRIMCQFLPRAGDYIAIGDEILYVTNVVYSTQEIDGFQEPCVTPILLVNDPPRANVIDRLKRLLRSAFGQSGNDCTN